MFWLEEAVEKLWPSPFDVCRQVSTAQNTMHRSRLALQTCKRALSCTATQRAAAASPSASYQPPVKPGSLPAYDAALEYIQQDRDSKLKQLEQLKQQGAAQEALDKLEVEAWSNDPETRWRAKQGAGTYLRDLGKDPSLSQAARCLLAGRKPEPECVRHVQLETDRGCFP